MRLKDVVNNERLIRNSRGKSILNFIGHKYFYLIKQLLDLLWRLNVGYEFLFSVRT